MVETMTEEYLKTLKKSELIKIILDNIYCSKWNNYPEVKPEKHKNYLVRVKLGVDKYECLIRFWYGYGNGLAEWKFPPYSGKVVAWKEFE